MLWWELRAGWLWRSALREICICTALGLSLGRFQGPRQLCLTSSQHGHFWALLLSDVYGNAGVFIFSLAHTVSVVFVALFLPALWNKFFFLWFSAESWLVCSLDEGYFRRRPRRDILIKESGTVESSVFFPVSNTSPSRVRSGMTPQPPKATAEVSRPLPAQVHCQWAETPDRGECQICPLAPASSLLRGSGKVDPTLEAFPLLHPQHPQICSFILWSNPSFLPLLNQQITPDAQPYPQMFPPLSCLNSLIQKYWLNNY